MHGSGDVSLLLPAQQTGWFYEARDHYLAGRFREALEADRRLLRWAEAERHLTGRVLGHRFIGLCHFRLGELTESAEQLRKALVLAEDSGCLPQTLLCANHLGATRRRYGDLLEAYDLLQEYMQKATLPDYVHERARLRGNLGALLDELGQREAAADQYARMEELCEIIGHSDRLANARGLAARSADLRGDLEIALTKYEDERRLSLDPPQNILRTISATLHLAKVHLKLGDLDEAERLCEDGLVLAKGQQYAGRLVDAWLCRSRLRVEQGRLSAAAADLKEASVELQKGPDHGERSAEIASRLAEICKAAGLHGEALHHLMESVELRYQLYEPLRRNARVRKMAERRLEEMKDIAMDLAREGCLVARTEKERDALCTLIGRVRGQQPSWAELEGEIERSAPQWTDRTREATQRAEAERLWRKLLPGSFDRLHPDSQQNLIQAEIHYQRAATELQTCAQLLATVLERELRERLFFPLKAAPSAKDKGLGEMLRDVQKTQSAASSEWHQRLAVHLAPQRGLVPQLGALLRLQPVDARPPFAIDQLRNDLAHGNSRPPINRLMVDAVKRALLLTGDPPLLHQLALLPPIGGAP